MIAFGNIGKTVTFTVLRQGRTLEVTAVVAAMPERPGTAEARNK